MGGRDFDGRWMDGCGYGSRSKNSGSGSTFPNFLFSIH